MTHQGLATIKLEHTFQSGGTTGTAPTLRRAFSSISVVSCGGSDGTLRQCGLIASTHALIELNSFPLHLNLSCLFRFELR